MKRPIKQSTVTRAGVGWLLVLGLGTFGSVQFSQAATNDLRHAVQVSDASKDAAIQVSASSAMLTNQVRQYSVTLDPKNLDA